MRGVLASIVGVSCSAIVALIIRRMIRVRAARAAFRRIAHNSGLDVLSAGYFRVCITGTSCGIGKACKDLLSEYASVEIVSVGRRGAVDIHADLTDDASVRNCVNSLVDKWYNHTDAPSAGLDIMINNAGIFDSPTPSTIWETNTVAPCFITESLTEFYLKHKIKSRMLRFVQVSSRLESRSALTTNNIRQIATEALSNGLSNIGRNHYADSKRALTLHTAYMCQKYRDHPSLSFVTVTPGMVNTELGRTRVSGLVWVLTTPLRFMLQRHPIEGAVPILWAAFGCPSESGVFTADQEILERITETRKADEGRAVSQVVNEHFNLV